MSGLLEESLQIQAMDLDDVVIPVEMSATAQPSPTQSQAGTLEIADPSTATVSASPSTGETENMPDRHTNNASISTHEMTDEDVCRDFIEQTCGCKKSNGRPCSSQFSMDYYIERRAQASLLTRSELDLVMLGSIMSTTRIDEDVTHGRHKPVKRQRPRVHYLHNGCEVCKVTFGFIFGVGRKHKIDGIRKHYMDEGLTPRVHKNSKLRPHNALSFCDVTSIVDFLQNYAEQHAILLPGRIPGYKRDDIKLLPSSNSKKVFKHNINTIRFNNTYLRPSGIAMRSHPRWLTSG